MTRERIPADTERRRACLVTRSYCVMVRREARFAPAAIPVRLCLRCTSLILRSCAGRDHFAHYRPLRRFDSFLCYQQGFDRGSIIIKVFQDALRIVVGQIKFVFCYFPPLIMQNVIAQHAYIFVRSL
jgi:hypothetical protein